MQVTQIASIVNEVNAEMTGTEAVENIDLNNVVEVGSEIIESGAFGNCQNLTRVEIKDAKTRIAENAFFDCENIKDVVLPADADPSYYDKVFK